MKLQIFILFTCFCVICSIRCLSLNNFQDSLIFKQFEGILIDVNSNESLILYELPDAFSSEYSKGKLICHQIATNNDIIISDSVKIYENLHAKFLNDTIVIVTTEKNIWLYNLKQKKYFDKLTNLKSYEYVLAFNISQDKHEIIFIVFNSKDLKFQIYCLDFKKHTLIKTEHNINALEYSDEEYYCSIFMYNNYILFNIQNNLYILKKGANKDTLITNQLSFNASGVYLYAVDLNNIIFIEGYDDRTKIKSYDLKDGLVKQINFNLKIPIKYNEKIIILSSVIINNQYKIQLLSDFPYFYENNNFFKQQDLIIFKGAHLIIKRNINKNKDAFSVYKLI